MADRRSRKPLSAFNDPIHEPQKMRICLSDGEHHNDDPLIGEGEFDVAIIVLEKARVFSQNPKVLEKLAKVCFDELALLNDEKRGPYLEILLTQIAQNPALSVLGTMRYADDIDPILHSLANETHTPFLIKSFLRPVPIQQGIFDRETREILFINSNSGEEYRSPSPITTPSPTRKTLKTLITQSLPADSSRQGKIIFATPFKDDSHGVANTLAALFDGDPQVRASMERNARSSVTLRRLQDLPPTSNRNLLINLAKAKVSLHNADFSLEERKVSGDNFRRGDTVCLVSTSTTAEGTNMGGTALYMVAARPFGDKITDSILNWMGRIARYGSVDSEGFYPAIFFGHEPIESPISQEILRQFREQTTPIHFSLFSSPFFAGHVLSALHGVEAVSIDELINFFQRTPSGASLNTESIRTQVTGAVESLIEKNLVEVLIIEGEEKFSISSLGRITSAYGLQPETTEMLIAVLTTHPTERGLDLIDLLYFLSETPDGKLFTQFRTSQKQFKFVQSRFTEIREYAASQLGTDYSIYSPLEGKKVSLTLQALMLSLRDWTQGVPLLEEDAPDTSLALDYSIEKKYGLRGHNSNIYEAARNYSRLVNAMDALSEVLHLERMRPDLLPSMTDGFVSLPADLNALGSVLLYGLPEDQVGLARTGIEGLDRYHVRRIVENLNYMVIAPDLPIVDRTKIALAEREILPDTIPRGLLERLNHGLERKTSTPLAEELRSNPQILDEYYGIPFVQHVLAGQGSGRHTAIKILTRHSYTTIRRNREKNVPIDIISTGELDAWRAQGAVEFLGEIGHSVDQQYVVDRFLVDLDPKNGYPLSDLANLAEAVAYAFRDDARVNGRQIYVHWSGGKGFHIVGHFKEGVELPVEEAKRSLQLMLRPLMNDSTIFLNDQPGYFNEYVIADLSPVMRRGIYRNVFSLNAKTSQVCVPVKIKKLQEFDPVRDAALPVVLKRINSLGLSVHAIEGATYHQLVQAYILGERADEVASVAP